MQTFLPYPDFAKSAACLDRQRLGKQRLEVQQILNALRVPGAGWANHPATKMWRGYAGALVGYGIAIVGEWKSRGHNNSVSFHMWDGDTYGNPPWLGDVRFHSSHRASLLCKDPQWYGQFGWTETPEINYVWPDDKS